MEIKRNGFQPSGKGPDGWPEYVSDAQNQTGDE